MECTRRNSGPSHQTYEIHVSFPSSDVYTIAQRHERLRFLLLGSKWFPKWPLGILVWSALHVLLVVGYSSLMLLLCVTMIVYALVLDGFNVFNLTIFFLVFPFVFAPCSLIWLLMRVSWALMLCDRPQITVARKGFQEMWCRWWNNNRRELHDALQCGFTRMLIRGCFQLPGWKVVGEWCEEVVHLHDTFVI